MKKGIVLALVAVALVVGFFAHALLPRVAGIGNQPSGVDKLSFVIDALENNYVDSISRDSLLDLAVPFILSKLDPHSEYISADALAALNEPLVGNFDGIGIVFNMATDTAQVLNVVVGGPSAGVGIMAGDRIIAVNDSTIAGRKMNQMDVVKMLRGKKGSKVKLGVKRMGVDKLLSFDITRGSVPISSIEAAFVLDNGDGFIKLSKFAANTHKEFLDAVKRLKSEGAKRLILDLRGNSGGYLDQAIYLSNEFLKDGELILFVQGAHRPRQEQFANGGGKLQDMELAVLIDENSASSSEIFAGAMQDNDRATIVGRRSFGKGLIQEQVKFDDGSAARITIAKYFTPLGRPLQKPYTAGDLDGYNQEIYNRYSSIEMHQPTTHANSTDKVYTTKGGRTLYGGGGITPDVFVGVDTLNLTPYFVRLFSLPLAFDFSREFCDNHRSAINKIETIGDLRAFFDKFPTLYSDFLAYAARRGFATTAQERAANEKVITAELRGFIGRNTKLQESAFYYYIAPVDVITVAAMQNGN